MTSNRYLGAGFASLGLLVGSIAGLSTAELTVTLLGLLFALIGGSVIAYIKNLDDDSRKAAGVALSTFSVTATLSLYAGVAVRINDVLQARPVTQTAGQTASSARSDYLKRAESSEAAFLQAQVMRGELQLVEACNALKQ